MREANRSVDVVVALLDKRARTASPCNRRRTRRPRPAATPRDVGDRPRSTASETSERDSASLHSSEAVDSDVRLVRHDAGSGSEDSPDESTVKCNTWSGTGSDGGSAEHSSEGSSSSDNATRKPCTASDPSTRCDADFQWIRSDETRTASVPSPFTRPKPNSPAMAPPAASRKGAEASERVRRRGSAAREDRERKSRSSVSSKPPRPPSMGRALPSVEQHRYADSLDELHRRGRSASRERWERGRCAGEPHAQVYGSSRSLSGRWRDCGCACQAPPPPPCCAHQPVHYCHAPYYEGSSEERVRRLESEKESLSLQTSVLGEQLAAQAGSLADAQRALQDTRHRLRDADQRLQTEMLHRSSLETQKLELMSALSELRLRYAALERIAADPSPPTHPSHAPHPPLTHGSPASAPRTPPANYNRQIERNVHVYASLPRHSPALEGAGQGSGTGSPASRTPSFGNKAHGQREEKGGEGEGDGGHDMVAARGRGHSVPNLAERDASGTGSPGGTLRWGWRGGGTSLISGAGGTLEGAEEAGVASFRRGGVRATAAPRLQRDNDADDTQATHTPTWSVIPLKDWDAEVTCEWLESLGLEMYTPEAKKWLTNSAGNKGILSTASPQQIEKELALKNPLHKKKILLAILDLQGSCSAEDPWLRPAGGLASAWVLRWLEDVGLPQLREAATAARLDARVLHRLAPDDLAHGLRITTALHALSLKRGIQVLRDNNFSPETMIRRCTPAAELNDSSNNNTLDSSSGEKQNASNTSLDAAGEGPGGDAPNAPDAPYVARWSSHRVMEWLRAVDLAEYAPNLRGAGVHGGLMLLEPRFTAELLATLLNIPASKTLLRRHLTTRFNQLLGRDVIQEKREAEQTLGYQPLTITTKYKVPKKGQFSLKRKKNKTELDYGDLLCPLAEHSDDEMGSESRGRGRVGCLSPA